MEGGENKKCLFEYQRQILQQIPHNIVFHKGYQRCADWRALNQSECGEKAGMPTTGKEYFDALGAEEPKYYWR